jgi:hypothetical protein
VIDQNRPATCATTRLDVSPSVPNSKTSTEIDVQVPRGGQQHTRLRLATVTAIRIVVVTYPKIIKPNAAAQEVVYFLDSLARQTSTGDLWLVRDNDQKKAMMAQPFARLWNAG